MSVSQSTQLKTINGLTHIPSGEVYKLQDVAALYWKENPIPSIEEVINTMEELYTLPAPYYGMCEKKGFDSFHKFMWECANKSDRAIMLEHLHDKNVYIQKYIPEFDLTEFEII